MKHLGRLALAAACLTAATLSATSGQAQAATGSTPAREALLTAVGATISPSAHTYFISPTGSDRNPGTKDAPFSSLMRAQAAASPGDIVYIRGGRYENFTIPETSNPFEDIYHYVNDISKSGITYAAYPGDPRPVFDFHKVPTDQRVAAFYVETGVTNVTFVGFDVTGVKVGNQKQSEAFRVAGGANMIDMAAHDNQANGFYYTMDGTGVVLDSDSYNNIGPTPTSAGNTDGFGAHAKDVWFINDRAWHNSDDGFDSISSTGRVAYINDWSFDQHGNGAGIGDQNGFKVGGYAYRTSGLPVPIPLHTVVNCLAVDNGANNFYANHQPGQSAYWFNNTASDPGYGANFNMLERVSPTSPDNIAGYREVLHNNLAFAGPSTANDNTPTEHEANNSWTIHGVPAPTAADFRSVDAHQLTAPRAANADTPTVDFLQLRANTALHAHGLGYLAHANDPYATVASLVAIYTSSGDIDNQGVGNSLRRTLQAHNREAFLHELQAQSGHHLSEYAARTLRIAAIALTL